MRRAIVFAVALWRVAPLLAQQGVASQLTGRVVSAGQSLSSVTVTIRSDALQGTRVTTTGENGGYMLVSLPPGEYEVRFVGSGFTPVDRHVRIALAESARVDADLAPLPLNEIVNVSADSPRANGTVAAALLQRLPGGRDIRAAVLLSPSAVSTRGRLAIAGAQSWESLYLVDGVAVNEYLSGQPVNLFIEDALDEIAVLTNGISAEYGRFTGGVVASVTKQGGNEFRGSGRDTITDPAWTRRTPWPGTPAPAGVVNYAAEATFGGFLAKDRLWFFGAVRNARAARPLFTNGTNIPYRGSDRDQRSELKLTAQVTNAYSLIATYTDSLLTERNALDTRVGASTLDLDALIPIRQQPATLLAITLESLASENTFGEVHAAHKRYALRGNGGQSSDRVRGTVIVVRNRGNLNAPFGCGICGEDRRNSGQWSAKGSRYRNTPWGNHNVVGGVEGFREQRSNHGTRSSSEFNILSGSARSAGMTAYPLFDPSTTISWTPPFTAAGSTNLETLSAFINDQWEVSPRLMFNLGARYDRNHASDALGDVIARDGALSPRLGARVDLRNDGRHQLLATYGRYAAKLLENGGSSQQVGVFTQFGWRYLGEPINTASTPPDQLLPARDALARLFAWFDSVGGVRNRQFLTFFTDPLSTGIFNGSLKSPVVDERSLGYAMQFRNGSLRADAIARDWHHFYAMRVDTTTGSTINAVGNKTDLVEVVNDDTGTVRRYRAIQLQGEWRWKHVDAGGGYTWSTLRGNDDSEEGVTFTAPRNAPLALWYPEFLGYAQRRPVGYLKQDVRHRARVWIGGEVPLAPGTLSAFVLQGFESGRPYSALGDIDATGRVTPYKSTPVNPGYRLNQNTVFPYYFSTRGAFRTDDVFSTDLSLAYERPFRGAQVFVKGDALNVFDNGAVIAPSTEVLTRFRNGAASGLSAFNPFNEKPVEGVHYQLADDFGKPTGPGSYQAPRTFQISVGVRF